MIVALLKIRILPFIISFLQNQKVYFPVITSQYSPIIDYSFMIVKYRLLHRIWRHVTGCHFPFWRNMSESFRNIELIDCEPPGIAEQKLADVRTLCRFLTADELSDLQLFIKI